MAENSKIEWTTHTGNLWHGCTRVSEGCTNCYAETLSHRWGRDLWGNDKPRMIINSFLKDIARYQKLAAAAGEIHRVFVGSMMDIFEKSMPLVTAKGEPVEGHNTGLLRDGFFHEVVPACPNLLFLLLTKRPSNINKMIPESWKEHPPKNVMFGTSPVDQETANTLIPQLLQVNGKRFLSIEPQLGHVNLFPFVMSTGWIPSYENPDNYDLDQPAEPTKENIHWVICGGESGHGRRQFNTDWARDLKYQCHISDIPFFMKQIDKVIPIPEDLLIREYPKI